MPATETRAQYGPHARARFLSSQRAPEQDADALSSGVLRAFVDLLIRQSAERVSDHDRGEIVHAERIALHLCLM